MSAKGANMSGKGRNFWGVQGLSLWENFEIGLATNAIFCVPWTSFHYT